MPYDAVNSSILDTLSSSKDLTEIADQLMEVTLDSFWEDGLAKDLPLVSIFRNIRKTAFVISDHLLEKKLITFLRGLASVPPEQRRQQIAKLLVDTDYRHHLGENLMLLLDKLNDMRKPEMLAKIWRAYLEGEIQPSSLFGLCHAVADLHVEDIALLPYVYRGSQPADLPSLAFDPAVGVYQPPYNRSIGGASQDWQRLMHLSMCGLLDLIPGRGGTQPQASGLRENALGKLFVKIVL
jgi:hypothetical protein